MTRFTDVFWPILEKPSSHDLRVASDRLADVAAKLEGIAPYTAGSVSTLLEEARRMTAAEAATRSVVETRAGIYLAATGTLVPIATFVAGVPTAHLPWPLVCLRIASSLVAIAYLFSALRWAFKSLSVRNYHRVGVSDVPNIAGDRDPDLALTKNLFLALLKNRVVVNEKVDAIRMSEAFLVRAVTVLLFLLALAQAPAGFQKDAFTADVEQIIVCNNTITDPAETFGSCRLVPTN